MTQICHLVTDPQHIDEMDVVKILLLRNEVHGNQNFIPFYSECRDDPECAEENGLSGPIPDYGTEEQTRQGTNAGL